MIKIIYLLGSVAIAIGLAWALAFGLPASAEGGSLVAIQASIVVNTLDDEDNADGDCALREAIHAANENIPVDACPSGDAVMTDTITFAVSGMIPLSIGQLEVMTGSVLAIDGEEVITISGDGSVRAFYVNSGAQLTLDSLTITDGYTPDEGGGIYNLGALTIMSSTLTGNAAGGTGGGIYNQGSLILSGSTIMNNNAYGMGGLGNTGSITLTNVTVSGNLAAFTGGIGSTGSATLNNVTINDNTAVEADSAGGIEGEATLRNSIVANNPGGNCLGGITSAGYNLDNEDSCNFNAPGDLTNTDARLGNLSDNGGPTFTHALLTGSPAIDAGACTDDSGSPILIDQRGASRPQGASCDIGAFEGELIPSYLYLPIAMNIPFPVEAVVTARGEAPGYPTTWWVYGYINNLTSSPVYSTAVGIEVTYYPYCEPNPCDPYEMTEIVYPAFTASLPGQINPFSWSLLLGKAYATVGQVKVVSASYTRGNKTYYPLSVLDWQREENAVVGNVRNDSGENLVNGRVVIASDECDWREAALTNTNLQADEETDFRLEYFSCTGEDVTVIGQANSGP